MDKKFLAIGIVAVLVIAGVAAFFVLQGDDDEEYVPANTDGRLMIFGNANNDDYLDKNDRDFIRDIVENGTYWDKEKNPYADANNDKAVDQKDLDFIDKMINREPMNIWYLDGDDKVKEIKYPLKNIAIVGNTQMTRAQALDILDKVQGISGTALAFDNVLHKTLDTKPRISNSSTNIDLAMYSEVAQNVPGGIDAVFCANNSMSKQEAVFEENGINLVHMESSTLKGELRTYLTFGYLVEAEQRSHELAEFMDSFDENFDAKIDSIAQDKRITALVSSSNSISPMGGIIVSQDRIYSERIFAAGAINKITNADLGGSASKSIQKNDVWHLDDKFDSDVFVDLVTGFGYHSTIEDFAKFWKNIFLNDDFSMTKLAAYPDGFCVMSRDLPCVVYLAYLGEFFYPDLFGEGYADKIHQEWGDRFFVDLKGFDASKTNILVSYDDVKAYL